MQLESHAMLDKYAIDSTKIAHHPDKLSQWKSGSKSVTPIYVEVSPVGYCNHSCSFCALDFLENKTTRLKENRLSALMAEFGECGVKSVMFAGEGEPLLHPELDTVIEYASKHGVDVAITTNGIPLTAKYHRVFPYISWIKVSLNGGDPATYAKVHGTYIRDWDIVWDNISRATSYVYDNKIDTVIGIQCVVLPENIHSIRELVERAKFYGVEYVVLKPYSQHKKSIVQKDAGFMKESWEVLEEIIDEYNSDGFQVIGRIEAMESVAKPLAYPTCLAVPHFWAYVDSAGNVWGCSCFLGDKRFLYGNITETFFSNIWLGRKRMEAIRVMEGMSTKECRQGCRMDKVNSYLWMLKRGCKHVNFI